MITLAKAIKLTRLQADDLCYLRKIGTSRFDAQCLSVREIREQYDMKATKVLHIAPRFEMYGPDYQGIEFETTEVKKLKRRWHRCG